MVCLSFVNFINNKKLKLCCVSVDGDGNSAECSGELPGGFTSCCPGHIHGSAPATLCNELDSRYVSRQLPHVGSKSSCYITCLIVYENYMACACFILPHGRLFLYFLTGNTGTNAVSNFLIPGPHWELVFHKTTLALSEDIDAGTHPSRTSVIVRDLCASVGGVGAHTCQSAMFGIDTTAWERRWPACLASTTLLWPLQRLRHFCQWSCPHSDCRQCSQFSFLSDPGQCDSSPRNCCANS